jgi:hypothetical protein
LARQAADKAEATGQHEKAAKLREKADYLEEILNNTQNPDYSDEEEGTPPSSQDAGDRGGASKSSGQNSSKNGSGAEEPEESGEENSKGSGNGEAEENEETDSQGGGSGSGNEEQKQPEDIADLDQHTGSHASGTNQHKGGGPSGGNEGGGSGGSESNSGESSPKNQEKGQGKGKGQSQELDPFRVKKVQGQSQQKQPTKEEILAAIIKRLSGLSGDAKKGADRALQDYFNDISGGGNL